jgi:hypothetical protein
MDQYLCSDAEAIELLAGVNGDAEALLDDLVRRGDVRRLRQMWPGGQSGCLYLLGELEAVLARAARRARRRGEAT